MSENTLRLAEQIAGLLQESELADASLLRGSIEKINRRLDRIESQIGPDNPQSAFRNPLPIHPSFEKFNIGEIIEIKVNSVGENEKACPYEPAGKPCDHCSMCSSLGF